MPRWTGFADRATGFVSNLPMHRWVLVIAAVSLGLSSAFGGLKDAPERPAALDKPFDAGPWTVTITGGRLVGELPPMYLSDKENNWIVVLATIEVTADRTWRYLTPIIQLAPTEGIKQDLTKNLDRVPYHPAAGIVLLRDATKVDQLNPGMPEKLAFFWELEAGAPIPTELKVYLAVRKYREDNLTSKMEWMDHAELNQPVVVPIVDRRAETAASS
jgi:hypothetical protein